MNLLGLNAGICLKFKYHKNVTTETRRVIFLRHKTQYLSTSIITYDLDKGGIREFHTTKMSDIEQLDYNVGIIDLSLMPTSTRPSELIEAYYRDGKVAYYDSSSNKIYVVTIPPDYTVTGTEASLYKVCISPGVIKITQNNGKYHEVKIGKQTWEQLKPV